MGLSIDEISAIEFRVKIRAGLSPGTWQQHGKQLFDDCAAHDHPVLLVIDELPIFLKRMLSEDGGDRRADEFLGWLRYVRQSSESRSPVFLVSGSIGLAPLVTRLGIPDRINDLHDFRLKPWSRKVNVECFERLAASYGLPIDDVAGAVYEALDVLEHDGYLEAHIDGHHIPFRLQKDWWAARFRDHHIPLESRLSAQGRSGSDLMGFRGQNSDPNRGGVR